MKIEFQLVTTLDTGFTTGRILTGKPDQTVFKIL